MAKFISLWMRSQSFRKMFLLNGIFPSINHVDKKLGEMYWDARYPKIEWDLCGVNGCTVLVPEGDACGKHVGKGDEMPLWRWNRGELYRYVKTRITSGGRVTARAGDSRPQYTHYRTWVASKKFGKLPDGYRGYPRDGNPFNIKDDNIIVLSKVAIAVVSTGMLRLSEVVRMDDVLDEFLADVFKQGRPKSQWLYTVADIAKLCGFRNERVRQEISRGNLDPRSLASVVEFCKKHAESDTVIVDSS